MCLQVNIKRDSEGSAEQQVPLIFSKGQDFTECKKSRHKLPKVHLLYWPVKLMLVVSINYPLI